MKLAGPRCSLLPAETEKDSVEMLQPCATVDPAMLGGRCGIDIRPGCAARLTDEVLGEVDDGMRYAQVRLGPPSVDPCHAVDGGGAAGARGRS